MLPANLVEEYLTRAEWSWRISRFLQRSALIGIVALGFVLALGFLARVGWLNHLGLAVLLLVLTVVLSGMVWLITALVTLTAPLDRGRVGLELEQVEPRLLDRVNALVHLEGKLDKNSPLLAQLANQSAEVLTTPGAGRPRIAPRVLRTLTILLLLGLLTATFYRFFQPLQHVRQAELAAAELRQLDEDRQRLEIPDDTWLDESPWDDASPDQQEEEPLWTEIRIRDPGRDLRATRYDLIPLVIEAYSTQPLDQIRLTIHVLGREPERILLPSSEDPHYALQEYELDLLSLNVAEWDVIQYFAEIQTTEPRQSDLYFIDVLPTQEELEQLAQNADDESYRTLRELTHLMQQQQNVLRDQHQGARSQEQEPAASPDNSERTQRNRIAEQQSRIAESTRQLADRLSDVAQSPESPELTPGERFASDSAEPPESSQEDEENGTDRRREEETATPPSSENSMETPESTSPENQPSGPSLPERLRQIAEQLGWVSQMARSPTPEQSLKQSPEQSLANSLENSLDPPRNESLEHSREELTSQLNDSLSQLAEARREAACQIPQRRGDSTEEPQSEADLLSQGGERPSSDGNDANDGTDANDGGERQQGDSSGTNDGASGDAGGEEAPSDAAQEGEEAGEDGEGVNEGAGTREGADSNGEAAGGDQAEARELGERGDGMPDAAGGVGDSLRESGREAWRRAARQLESLERRQASGQPLDRQQEQLLRDDTASQLVRALDSWLGGNQASEPPLARLREELQQPRDAMDWNVIRELMEQVQRQSRESIPRSEREAASAELKNIESSRFSPAYRDALERYFQKLSESP